MPPSLDVLIAASRPSSTSGLEQFSEHESLFYPSHLPLTTNLEIANHPILDTVRNTLFPSLPAGHFLTVLRDKLQIWLKGNGMRPQPKPNDMRVATILVTLPVKFRGGSLVVRSPEGSEERYHARGTKVGEMEWTALLSDSDYEIEPVTKGLRITISYAVHVKSFGTAAIQPRSRRLIEERLYDGSATFTLYTRNYLFNTMSKVVFGKPTTLPEILGVITHYVLSLIVGNVPYNMGEVRPQHAFFIHRTWLTVLPRPPGATHRHFQVCWSGSRLQAGI